MGGLVWVQVWENAEPGAVISSGCCLLHWRTNTLVHPLHPICPVSLPRSKVDHIHDILTGNATVIRMVVSFYRNTRGQNALRQILGGPVQEVLQDKTLSIRTNPVDIYKAWINQTESQSGQKRSGPGQGGLARPQGDGRWEGDGDIVFRSQQAPIRGQP